MGTLSDSPPLKFNKKSMVYRLKSIKNNIKDKYIS